MQKISSSLCTYFMFHYRSIQEDAGITKSGGGEKESSGKIDEDKPNKM